MTTLQNTDNEFKDALPSEEENQEEESSSYDQTEKVEPANETEMAKDQENPHQPIPRERIKSVKSDVGLVMVNENDKKLDENIKMEVDKNSKCNSENDEEESLPPALPPRPPPRPRQPCSCVCELDERDIQERNEDRVPRSCWANGLRKYVFLCTACGSLSILLGALFLIVYFMLKSYTSSLNHFETIPTYVPSGMLIATGFLIICLACRKNRNSFLMKLSGLCSLCCAVLCVSVTVTTTVIHMNRLQTLRECLYTLKTQSCTCYSVLMDNDRISDEGIKFVFNSTPDCEVIHGALYSCLRAIFGLSVIGILVCIFSCMLVYQLLSHEKKKMYWAQLEMRCRYLYRQQRNPHYYSCCDECRYPPHAHELFPWDLMGNRFWSSGRIGNLYTPNPEDRGNHNRLTSGWNWRRLPWSRSATNSSEPTRANLGSPDSQYGFSSTPTVDGTPYTVLDPRTSAGITACHAGLSSTADVTEGGFYSWGPPPPYASNRNSANNSPARRTLGDILHQVSPIRRNDNVSPARGLHHVHRHHMHHNRQCASSARQIPSNVQNQSDSLQKTTLFRTTPITNVIQQQQAGMDPLWSNSLSSVHRFQKVIQNKTNYENMYDSENIPPTSGFNTLPSLKKRNQPRMSDIFQDETSTAYFFSSAENLGCSTSNIKMQTQNESLPPRVFLKSSQPNSSLYPATSLTQNFSFNDLNTAESLNQSENPEGSSTVTGNRPVRSNDCNTSLVKKLFVNCSPSKQKPRNSQSSRAYPLDRGQNMIQTPKKKINKKPEPKDISVETNNENVITFHYRVGIPRSPDIQDFNQFLDKSSYIKSSQEGNGYELSEDKVTNSEISQTESQKVSKNTKYITKDAELIQKQRNLIKEFNKNLDLQNKFKNNRTDIIKNNGMDNENFIHKNDSSRELKQNFSKSTHSNMRQSPGINHMILENRPNFQTNESPANEDYLLGNIKGNENESDVYFGDISNSSCYMSLQNDGLESLMYEDTAEERMHLPKFANNGHPVLNKQNLKMMENESLVYNEMVQRHDGHSENTNSRHHQNVQDATHPNCRHRNSRPPNSLYQSSDEKTAENCLDLSKQEAKQHEALNKTPRHFINNTRSANESLDSKLKYLQGMQDHYRQPEHHHESVNSNDEQSSGSLTADSGISTGTAFIPPCFENAYHEIDPKGAEKQNVDDRGNNFDEKFPSFTSKISNLNFSHPLFQKPKVLPRGNRYKEIESRQKMRFEVEESESGNDGELDCQNKRKKNVPSKPKSLEMNEEVSNQLLSTCNLTLTRNSDHFMEDDQFDSSPNNQEKFPFQEENFQVALRKSPKPLPRTSVLNKTSGENNDLNNIGKISRYLQDKEKLPGHFLAPDAQYEFQENFKGDPKPKIPIKAQALTKGKPAIPARPFNLQIEHKKSGKVGNLNIRMIRGGNESGCPIPRRRKTEMEDSEGKENDIGSHSVKV